MTACHVCAEKEVRVLLDCGPQPLCNRFPTAAQGAEYRHPFVLGQCQRCGVLQLTQQAPASELAPRVDWITYSEPEGHLDDMTELIAGLPGLTPQSVFAGVSFKDDSTLERLRRKGFSKLWRLDTRQDLEIQQAGTGAETIQDRVTSEQMARVAQARGRADVVLVRHVYEHAHKPRQFIQALKQLVAPNGYLIFEVPDCSRAIQSLDYSTLWEEHTLYLTPETFQHAFKGAGFSLAHFQIYPYAFENSLVAIARSQPEGPLAPLAPAALNLETERAAHFAEALPARRQAVQKYLADFRKNKGKIALLGAGHLACFFINLLEIKDHLQFVVDDNPHKQGLFMPGSRLPIANSSALIDQDIKLCLLCVNPEAEEKVAQRNDRFVQRGGIFASIFPSSNRALRV